MSHVECPNCGHRVAIVDVQPQPRGSQQVLNEAHYEASVSSQVTEMALEMSEDVDRLESELRHWKRAFVRLASRLQPEAQVEAALLVAELDDKTRARVLEVAEALRNGVHPWGR